MYIPILGIYLLALPNATANTLGIFTMIASISALVMEVPSGYLSDRMGHTRALKLSRVLLLASSLIFTLGNTIPWFFLGTFFRSAGTAFTTGTSAAFMHETLQGLDRDHEYSKVMGIIRSIGYAASIIFVILIPIVSTINFKYGFAIAALVDVAALIASLFLVAPPTKTKVVTQELGLGNFIKTLKESHSIGLLKYSVFSGTAMGLYIGISIFKNPYQESIGIPIALLGILWALSRGSIAIVLPFSGWLKERITLHQYYGAWLVLFILFHLLVGMLSSPIAVATLFVLLPTLVWGTDVIRRHFFLEIIGKDNESKATLLSLEHFVSGALAAVIGIVAGVFAAKYSYSMMYILTALLSMLLLGIQFYAITRKR